MSILDINLSSKTCNTLITLTVLVIYGSLLYTGKNVPDALEYIVVALITLFTGTVGGKQAGKAINFISGGAK